MWQGNLNSWYDFWPQLYGCGMSSRQCFWHFKTWNPSELLYHTKFSRKPILPRGWVWIYFRRFNVERLSDLLFVIIPSYYALYLDLSDKFSVKATANQMQMWERQITQILLPLYKGFWLRSLNGSTDDCVNPPRHVSSSTFSVHVMPISVSIKMCPFWLVILRPYFPNTWTVEPFLNSMLPLNLITAARCSPCELEEDLFSCDAL